MGIRNSSASNSTAEGTDPPAHSEASVSDTIMLKQHQLEGRWPIWQFRIWANDTPYESNLGPQWLPPNQSIYGIRSKGLTSDVLEGIVSAMNSKSKEEWASTYSQFGVPNMHWIGRGVSSLVILGIILASCSIEIGWLFIVVLYILLGVPFI